MAQIQIQRVEDALKNDFSQDQLAKVRTAIVSNLPPKTYNLAVVFLGLATLVLTIGSVVLLFAEREVADALWGAVGAGIGGLAGIFMAKDA